MFCRLFDRRYYNNSYIFVWPMISTEHLEAEIPIFRPYYPARDGFARVIARILGDMGFQRPFRNRRHDIRCLMRAVRDRFPRRRALHQNFQLAVLSEPFYRNKAAYIIGKAINGADQIPFAIPILNDEGDADSPGGLYVDTLLSGGDEISDVFSFSRAYFMVDTEVPAAVVDFLRPLMPHKGKAELYTAIGLQKFGKAEFYRDFLKHLRYSADDFVVAPGIRGMVMCVFTLPSFPFVFKVIKDRFPPPKEMTRETVKEKYQLVKLHDRVGRMADSWEYSHVAFPRHRFSAALVEMLETDCAKSLESDGDQLIIKHLYIERRMSPLNLYLHTADDEDIRHAIGEYGDAIKQLAAANIFPGDFLLQELRRHASGSRRLLRLRRAVLPDRVPFPRDSARTLPRDGDGRGGLVQRRAERRLPGGVRDLPADRPADPQGLPRAAQRAVRPGLVAGASGAHPGGPSRGRLSLSPKSGVSARRLGARTGDSDARGIA